MNLVTEKTGLLITLLFILSAGVPNVSSSPGNASENWPAGFSLASEVMDVPYVWQEINGFCHWAAYSMILQHAGVPLNLYSVFAATGTGFSATYLRYDTNMLFIPGPFFRQMVSTLIIEEMYGVNVTVSLDPTASDLGGLLAEQLGVWNVEFNNITGWEESFEVLKDTIDSGYPIEIWADPYYLPVWDYDILREMNMRFEDTSTGHAVVVVGYNETAGTVRILDPGVGAFGDVGYPADARYDYEMTLVELDRAWSSLFYGSFIVRPGEGISKDLTSGLGNYILDRMRGDRASYGPEIESAFFWVLGSDAFRGLAYDLTSGSLSSYVNEFGDLGPSMKAQVLRALGMTIEGFLSIQYLSFRAAVESLSDLLPELELGEFVTEGRKAFEHFESLSDNSTMVSFNYDGGASITTDTFNSIADDCSRGKNVDTAVTNNEEDLNTIRSHLSAIADAWDAAAGALDRALNGNISIGVAAIGASTCASIGLALIYARRRSKP